MSVKNVILDMMRFCIIPTDPPELCNNYTGKKKSPPHFKKFRSKTLGLSGRQDKTRPLWFTVD